MHSKIVPVNYLKDIIVSERHNNNSRKNNQLNAKSN